MSTGRTIDPILRRNAEVRLEQLIGTQLKKILKSQDLPQYGAKALLQSRIRERLRHYHEHNDLHNFEILRGFIYNPDQIYPHSSPSSHSSVLPQWNSMGGGSKFPHANTTPNQIWGPGQQVRPTFKESPFHTVLQQLLPTQECKDITDLSVRENTRDLIETKIKFSPDVAQRLAANKSLRVMIYCAGDTHPQTDIAFPQQIEIRINGDEVKANMRGLKNKPGTTRPVDITSMLHKNATYENTMLVTYALTAKRYYLVVNLVKQNSCEDLVTQLRAGRSVSKEQVVREMAAKAEDTDIVTTSSVMSLKCPLSYTRLNTPCRGPKCSHNSCFDATSYLQLQEQATTWTCPICNSAAPFKQLFVDLYVTDILKSTPSSVEQVTIEPDGSWHQIREGSGEAHDSGDSSEIEIVEGQPPMPLKVESLAASNGFNGTPSYQSREQSTLSLGMAYSTNTQSPHSRGQSITSTSIQAPSSGGKRKSEVIDLTLSDDDDDDVRLRGPKRQMTNISQPAGQNYAMNGYGVSPNGFSPQQVLNLGQPRPPPSRLQSSEELYPYHWQ